MIKAIIFDYDDNLVQTRKTRYNTIYKLTKEIFNANITASVYCFSFGNKWQLKSINLEQSYITPRLRLHKRRFF